MTFRQTYAGPAARALILRAENRLIRFPIEVTVTEPVLPFDIEMRVVASDDDDPVLVCDDLRIRRRPGGPPVTSSALRDVPIAALVAETASRCAEVWPLDEDDTGEGPPRWGAGVSDAATRKPRRPGRKAITDGDLPELASVWKATKEAGLRATTEAVADHFNCSRPTAARAVQRARAAGLLPEV